MVGVDIPISEFEALAPSYQLGPLGYPLGLNENGFLVFHPFLWTNANYLEEPAHIDIEDVEADFEAGEKARAISTLPRAPRAPWPTR